MRAANALWIVVASGLLTPALVGCDDLPGPQIGAASGGGTTGQGGTGTAGAGQGGSGAGSGSGGMGGAGAGGGGGCTCVTAVAGATYYQLAQVAGTCPSGTPVTTLLDCDACSCEPACALQGKLDDDANCSGGGNIPLNAVSACLDNTNYSAPVYLEATVQAACTVPTAVPPLAACQLDAPVACNNGDGVCVPQGEPVCVVVDAGETCPAGFDATMRPIQEGGTCGCDCTASGTCPAEARVYSDNNCAQGEKTVAADDSCALATDAMLTVVGSIQPPDPPAAVTCQTSNSPNMGMARTLCCAASP